MLREKLMLLVLVALFGASCGATIETRTTSEEEGDSTESTTAADTESTESEADDDVPVLTPEYGCYWDLGVEVVHFFGYRNEGPEPVVVESGDQNNLVGNEENLDIVPVVFAPGEVFPAFWALTIEPGFTAPTWTLTGPDGVPRTASPDPDAECDGDELVSVLTDSRDPVIDVSIDRIDEVSVAITAELIGIPELSVCPAGLEPAPVDILFVAEGGIEENGSLELSKEEAGGTIRIDVDLAPVDKMSRAYAFFQAAVTDVCLYEDVETRSWPAAFYQVDSRGEMNVDVCVDAPGNPSAEPLRLTVAGLPDCSSLTPVDGVLVVSGFGSAGGGGMRIR